MPREFFVESFVESLFKIRGGSIGVETVLRAERTRNKFRRLFMSHETREATDLTHGTRFIVSNPKWRKGRPLSAIADLQTKETPIDCSARGTFHISSRETTLLSRSGDHIPPRSGFILLDWKVSNIGGRDPSTYIPMREFRGTPSACPLRRSPFYPVWFQRVGKIPNWEPGLHCGPGDRFLTDSVWFGVEWQTWEARSCSLLVVDVVVSPLFTPSISWKRRLIMFRPK